MRLENYRHPMVLGIVLDHPSPHMAGLLDGLARSSGIDVKVIYLARRNSARAWSDHPGPLSYQVVEDASDLRVSMLATRASAWVIASVYTNPRTWVAARAAGALNRVPWIYMNEPLRDRGAVANQFKQVVLKTLLSGASAVATTGTRACAAYQNLVGPSVAVSSIPYKIDLEPFLSLGKPRWPGEWSQPQTLRQPRVGGHYESNGSGSAVKLLCVGQLIERKGHEQLLRALADCMDLDWALELVGEGPLEAELRDAAQSFAHRVEILPPVPYERRHELFVDADVLVMPSMFDGWGMVVVEAMAAGCAVIASNGVMAAHDLIEPDVSGWIFPVGDDAALSACLRSACSAPGRVLSMGYGARQSALLWHQRDEAANLLQLVESLVHGVSRSSPTRLEVGNGAQDSDGEGSNERPGQRGEGTFGTSACQMHIERRWVAATRPKPVWRRLVRNAVLAGRALSAQRPARGARILAYHLVPAAGRAHFEQHMRFMSDYFEMVTIQGLVSALLAGHDVRYMAAVSFDDGFANFLGAGLEVLSKYSIPATLFVPVGFVASAGHRACEAKFCRVAHGHRLPFPALSSEALRTLTEAGHEIGSHGCSHASFAALSAGRANAELCDSRDAITQWTGREPQGFAYPYGIDRSAEGTPSDWVRAAGYGYAVTMRRGIVDLSAELFALPREHAEGHWPLHQLRAFLSREV